MRERAADGFQYLLLVGHVADCQIPANRIAGNDRAEGRTRLALMPRCHQREIRGRGLGQRTRKTPARKGVEQGVLHSLGQGGRQENDAATSLGVECQNGFEHALHVGIAGMHLVDDQYLAEQAKQAQGLVLAVERGKQYLIDRADPGRGQQRTLAVIGKPRIAASGGRIVLLRRVGLLLPCWQHRLGKSLDQITLPMCQHQAGVAIEQHAVDIGDTAVHGVCRGHGRQRDEEAVCAASAHHPMSEHDGRLGLAGAGNVFQQMDLWS